jgi:hypothetical protein
MMTGSDILALLPLLVIASTAIAVMLSIAFKRNHTRSQPQTRVGFGALLDIS